MPINYLNIFIFVVVGAGIGFGIGYLFRRSIAEGKINNAEQKAKEIISEAEKDAETAKKEILLEAKEEVHRLRSEFERDSRERRNEIQRLERRLVQKEETLDRKSENLEKKDEILNKKIKEVGEKEEQIELLYQKELEELERISGLTQDEAKELLLNDIQKEVKHEAAIMIKEIEQKTKEESEKKAKEIISYAIQKCAADHVAETTVSVVALPNDEMKGRIIGREGRNIRALETLTGIDLIIDDTPEAVILSGFDPIRREVARIALEKLIVDGRIHPARIEEMVEKAKKEVNNIIKEEGEQATFETGVHSLHPELIKLLGRLKFRTSYGQNVLKHSIEVSHLAGLMAAELGADVKLAKRAGLLHDIGKAVDHEVEGTHVDIGMDLLKKYKESSEVIHAMSTHHGDYEPQTVEAVLVTAADAVSAARPGARRETLETYIKRLQKLEEIANDYEGVEKSFAIQAGREIRIMVKPEEMNDDNIVHLARDITKRIENELEYPGQIKVNVIRETRAIEYAK
ncbi:ribonucrease Y [Geosporobacter subterraneus DSM 17957]|uniref:Ribonuclease Y n=1 Tax=Geosporobacter subterraneus DSM 17957 TaxID=1121919 RepID=A0A1M6DYS6_9FIRM|nr:ribonuclease Y [Geosporobacter subterraneus]SHI78417.1 ribonucrease Y [Geosporobacter subterraneus DSM 17957]